MDRPGKGILVKGRVYYLIYNAWRGEACMKGIGVSGKRITSK